VPRKITETFVLRLYISGRSLKDWESIREEFQIPNYLNFKQNHNRIQYVSNKKDNLKEVKNITITSLILGKSNTKDSNPMKFIFPRVLEYFTNKRTKKKKKRWKER
jgi:hypothetical protein